jgi:hypothetical protein
LKAVNDALSQRCLWPNDYQLDTLFLSYFSQLFYITLVNIKVVGNLGRASITRSDINFLGFRALG